jgi:hypothetical protein
LRPKRRETGGNSRNFRNSCQTRQDTLDKVQQIDETTTIVNNNPLDKGIMIMATRKQMKDRKLAQIAKDQLFVETLEVRGMDSLDFHDCGVAGIKAALEAAYQAGREAATFGEHVINC